MSQMVLWLCLTSLLGFVPGVPGFVSSWVYIWNGIRVAVAERKKGKVL
jgi:hypothetical protein